MNYTIAAIPTMYRGRQYRSRLEARWASFFDVVCWRPEYEPMDLNGWFPDFSIRAGQELWLVEVKPISAFDAAIGQRMVKAANAQSDIAGLMLVGLAPAPSQDDRSPALLGYTNPVVDGQLAGWRDSYVLYIAAQRMPGFQVLFGSLENLKRPEVRAYSDQTMTIWADACNSVQWGGSSK